MYIYIYIYIYIYTGYIYIYIYIYIQAIYIYIYIYLRKSVTNSHGWFSNFHSYYDNQGPWHLERYSVMKIQCLQIPSSLLQLAELGS